MTDLFEKQAGYVTRRQAVACGLTVDGIRSRLRSGRWRRHSAGIYRLTGVAAKRDGILVAATLKMAGAVVSHESAAQQLGFTHIPDGPGTVTVRRSTTHRWPGLRVIESTDLASSDCVTRGILTLTRPERTVIDLAATLRPRLLARVLDDALASRKVSLEALAQRHGEIARKGKPGTAALRELIEHRGVGFVPPESELEARMLDLLDRHGFPPPERQVEVPWLSGAAERVDLAYPSARLVIECDGRRWHTRESDFERDRRRDNEALLAGWRVLRVTWDQVVNDEAGVVSLVRRALDLAAA